MTHPEELLAGYVDGALTQAERAEVDAHLATCGTCREEMKLSTRAVAALAELPEEPVPLGVMNPVAAEIRRRTGGPAPAPWWGRLQWAAGLATAAALVAVVAVALPRLGEQEEGRALRAEAGASPTEAAPGAEAALTGGVFLEIQPEANYTAEELEALSSDAARQPDVGAPAPSAATVTEAAADAAKACLAEPGGLTEDDRLVRLIRARFDGKPAYLGVYLESPGAGQPPNRVVIWVVATKDCRILSFSSKQV